jgi:hypothetical protein
MMSMGHTYGLVMISVTKWCLRGEMPPQMRLEFLDHLEKQVDSVLTPSVIAIVEPIDNKGLELYREAMKLGFGRDWSSGPRPPCVWDVLYEKFDVFAALNPSLQRARDEACRPWSKGA